MLPQSARKQRPQANGSHPGTRRQGQRGAGRLCSAALHRWEMIQALPLARIHMEAPCDTLPVLSRGRNQRQWRSHTTSLSVAGASCCLCAPDSLACSAQLRGSTTLTFARFNTTDCIGSSPLKFSPAARERGAENMLCLCQQGKMPVKPWPRDPALLASMEFYPATHPCSFGFIPLPLHPFTNSADLRRLLLNVTACLVPYIYKRGPKARACPSVIRPIQCLLLLPSIPRRHSSFSSPAGH